MPVYDHDSINLRLKVLLCSPDHFEVVDEKNPHMQGMVGTVDKQLATKQWEKLLSIYQDIHSQGGLEEVLIIGGQEGCEDMVFCANQSFPWQMRDGTRIMIASKMKHESRQKEVPFFETFFKEEGYKVTRFQKANLFEGMGDTIPHPQYEFLFGGWGQRSERDAYEELSAIIEVPVVTLQLKDPSFYHLDTCFLPLVNDSLLVADIAFEKKDLEMLLQFFKNVIPTSIQEASHFFALNAHCFTGADGANYAIIQEGCPETKDLLEEAGYKVYETDTSEFIKSGGSVYCMKMMLY